MMQHRAKEVAVLFTTGAKITYKAQPLAHVDGKIREEVRHGIKCNTAEGY